jgi:hypothetical protein
MQSNGIFFQVSNALLNIVILCMFRVMDDIWKKSGFLAGLGGGAILVLGALLELLILFTIHDLPAFIVMFGLVILLTLIAIGTFIRWGYKETYKMANV